MAERRRRGDDAADEQLDDARFDDAVDDDALDSEEEETPRRGRGGTATKARPKAEGAKPVRRDTERVGFFGRIWRFVREVVAELRKVLWPTRKELLTYTAVVVVFVAVLMTIVGGLDYGFAKAVLWIFGSN